MRVDLWCTLGLCTVLWGTTAFGATPVPATETSAFLASRHEERLLGGGLKREESNVDELWRTHTLSGTNNANAWKTYNIHLSGSLPYPQNTCDDVWAQASSALVADFGIRGAFRDLSMLCWGTREALSYWVNFAFDPILASNVAAVEQFVHDHQGITVLQQTVQILPLQGVLIDLKFKAGKMVNGSWSPLSFQEMPEIYASNYAEWWTTMNSLLRVFSGQDDEAKLQLIAKLLAPAYLDDPQFALAFLKTKVVPNVSNIEFEPWEGYVVAPHQLYHPVSDYRFSMSTGN